MAGSRRVVEHGRFITLEGIDGAGKSTSMQTVCTFLRARGLDVLDTREPGGTPLGEALRQLLLERRDLRIGGAAETLIIFAARAQHLDDVIRPALDAGRWVACDRFTDATLAYQGGGRALGSARIRSLEQWVQQGLRPDLTLLFDLPVPLALERAGPRAGWDRFEAEHVSFLERVRQTYLECARREPARIRVIDASRAPEAVGDSVKRELTAFIGRVGGGGR